MNALLPPIYNKPSLSNAARCSVAVMTLSAGNMNTRIYKTKILFKDTAYYYPFSVNTELIQEACAIVKIGTNFLLFQKQKHK